MINGGAVDIPDGLRIKWRILEVLCEPRLARVLGSQTVREPYSAM